MRVVDIEDPAHPREIGKYNTVGDTNAVASSGDLIYIADGGGGVRVLDGRFPTQIRELSYFALPPPCTYARGLAVADGYVYIAYAGSIAGKKGLFVTEEYHRDRPSEALVKRGYFQTFGYTVDVVAQGSHVFVADATGGVVAVEFGMPDASHLTVDRTGNSISLAWRFTPDYSSFEVWRSTQPYSVIASPSATLVASGLPPAGCSLTGDAIACPIAGGIGDPSINYFYAVRGIKRNGTRTDTATVGEFDFDLSVAQ